ncbi:MULTISPECIES: selenium-dependent xanthine dehydrogenase [Atopobiaceae]|uniref:Selenium-dependent xanthine dehydrogenase n=1 Tax=Parafannyhessea umbonata TaxID=604330 RepID=A0A1H9QTB4_9ACTN|nr:MULTISPECIES: selenium-dependent xanthine dehydrogenase [Atopobiaceae]SEH44496.1 selenium-dependent xanthine dehydrogenase [Parafannyhessea umbonata]SER63704.1 selenium-dependent xanthine dehydrogenase [Parafannyhessea umbonata]SJZ60324.1 selenium-dependent xanthine dehydrogenase [Olsenella sp. KH1P3]
MSASYSFFVNGEEHTTTENKSLLRYLRDDLGLTSVKDGCSEGACGTCTVVIDGIATKGCVMTTKLAQGRQVLTIEGLSEDEREAFVYAFGSVGAVQCGFCIPGMVMSGAALVRQNPDPSEEEVKYAIRGNVCRCTGYKKIIEGIMLAAAILRGERNIEPDLERGENYGVGQRAFRVDVRRKVLGQGVYPDDLTRENYPDMAFASAVRSKYPRARVLSIDASKAEALPGVLGVLTAKDVPVNQVGHLIQDWDVMIAEGDITRCVGDAICLVVAESESVLAKAKKLVRISYEELEPVRNIEEARAEGAPQVHESFNAFGNHVILEDNVCQSRHVTRGNAKEAIANSPYVVTQHFETPFTEHAFLEPECAVAFPYKGGVKIQSTDQGAYDTRKEVAHMLGWDQEPERVVVETMLVGGGFGGKEDVSTQHLAALAALHFGRTVKCKFTRQESILFHPKRHAMDATFTLACDEDGIITGLDCEINFDTGAYASLCGPVLERACTHAVGPYTYQNTDIRGFGYYTNNPPAGAFRGFGVCQSEFALEGCIDLLADKVGISPWEIRWRNAIEPGKVLPNGQIADCSTALKETLLAVKDVFEKNSSHCGIACAMKNAGVGVGLPDAGRANIRVEDGRAVVYSATSDIGQGCNTVFLQDVAEATGLPRYAIANGECSTENAPDSGTTSGSRQTVVTGEAVRGVAFLLRDAMLSVEAGNGVPAQRVFARGDGKAIEYGDGTPYDGVGYADGSALIAGHGVHPKDPVAALRALEGCEFGYEYFEPTDKLGADLPNPKSHICYGFSSTVVVLEPDGPDRGRIREIHAAHDAGKVVNPIAIQGQIEGGVLMGMGYALTEDFPLKDCVPQAKYGTLGLLRSTDIPQIHAIYVEKDHLLPVAYGGKGIGEIATIGTAPAVQNAYHRLDGFVRESLPLRDTPYSR